MRLLKISAEDVEVITVADLKKQARVIHGDEDDFLHLLIKQALEQVSIDTNRTLTETTWQLSGARFPQCIHLPKPPFFELVSVIYVDQNGDEQAIDESQSQIIKSDVGASLYPAPGFRWPAVQSGNLQAVKVNFKAGYVIGKGGAQAGELPTSLRQAALLWAAHLYDYREAVTTVQANELPSYRCMVSPFEVDLI